MDQKKDKKPQHQTTPDCDLQKIKQARQLAATLCPPEECAARQNMAQGCMPPQYMSQQCVPQQYMSQQRLPQQYMSQQGIPQQLTSQQQFGGHHQMQGVCKKEMALMELIAEQNKAPPLQINFKVNIPAKHAGSSKCKQDPEESPSKGKIVNPKAPEPEPVKDSSKTIDKKKDKK